ncbi:MAG TPA: thioredoxin family protein [Gemmatimonadaceae bacterium]
MNSELHCRYLHAPTFDEYLDAARANQALWRAIADRVHVPDEYVERVSAHPGSWHLLVLSEDWCGDAVNTVPVIARLAELAPNLDCRILGRDANPDLMDTHLTGGTSRSIPIAILLDDHYDEHGWWGPRPRPLQQWVLSEGRALPKPDRYRETRRWYARDRGLTTLEEVVGMVEASSARLLRDEERVGQWVSGSEKA